MKALLQNWLRAKPKLKPVQIERLAHWQGLPETDRTATFAQSRFVVVDVETTGLNLMTDTLISIGAVAVVNGRIALGDSFSVVLQQQESSGKENILIHGISGSVQREGMAPVEALLSFLEYLGKDPLAAFHVTFDETMIRRAMRQYLGLTFKRPWMDLAYVMPALYPDLASRYRSLDEWSGHFDIRNNLRHNALTDALATAELFLVALAQARGKRIASFDEFCSLEKVQRWVKGEE